MVLKVIYLTRHGFRANWVVDSQTGVYSGTVKSPTNIPSDPPLAGYGEKQAVELAAHLLTVNPPVEAIYSSPFYRCLQTLDPVVTRLAERDGKVPEVRGENGLGEWYGTARFDHPSPAKPELLHQFFPFYSLDYTAIVMPSSSGETLDGVHDRTAYALDRIIAAIDKDPRQPTSLLICTHAATMIAAGRALTGLMPDNHEDADFKAFTCSVSRFERRPGHEASSASPSSLYPANAASTKTSGDFDIEWRGGRGVGGGWDCVVNGDCSFLSGGEERGWAFSGDESFKEEEEAAIAVDRDVDHDDNGDEDDNNSTSPTRLHADDPRKSRVSRAHFAGAAKSRL